MSITELLLLSLGLAMDAFSVSVCKGLSMKKIDRRGALVTALFFGGFQALMPLIGYFLGSRFEEYISRYSHWVAFILLGFIGGKMVWEVLRGEEEQEEEVIPESEELCKFIHPAIDKVRARKIHLILKRLVSSQDIQDICQYLNKMAKEELILQPVNPTTAYEELIRMGMPKTAGYSYKTFQKYYRK